MDDRVDVVEDRRYRFIEQPVSVRYDPDSHRETSCSELRLKAVHLSSDLFSVEPRGGLARKKLGNKKHHEDAASPQRHSPFSIKERLPDRLIDFDGAGF